MEEWRRELQDQIKKGSEESNNEFMTIFSKGMLENMVDVSTPLARLTHGGSIRGRRYAITMNDCSKIFLRRTVLLMQQNLGTDFA